MARALNNASAMSLSTCDRVTGALLGLALGDALGLPYEGISPRTFAREALDLRRFRLFGRTGFVSDDTEQTALLAHAVLGTRDVDACLRAFRRSMVGWLARLPFGIGGATLRACVRMAMGLSEPGVLSAGNGCAMRAGILGVHFADEKEERLKYGRRLAALTHTDPRAVEGALFVAEVAAATMKADMNTDRRVLIERCRAVVRHPMLIDAINAGVACALNDDTPDVAGEILGNTGFVVHSVGVCVYSFVIAGDDPMSAVRTAIRAGGDTDTHAAIVGGWVGAMHGAAKLPADLVERIHDGPFGPTHLRQLAAALSTRTAPPRWRWSQAFVRNLALFPVVLAHGLTRLWRR